MIIVLRYLLNKNKAKTYLISDKFYCSPIS